jgi:hypothetical protein
MVGVFSIFATLPILDMKEFGVGLAAAVLIDATIIRGVLLPASMNCSELELVPPQLARLAAQTRTQQRTRAPREDDQFKADNVDLSAVVEQLSASRAALERIAELADNQLDAIPRDGCFRFCDGQRTLEQVLASLLKHQRHQVDTLRAARPDRGRPLPQARRDVGRERESADCG